MGYRKMRYAAPMATTDYDPATRRRLGIDPPLQRSIGNQECPGCIDLEKRIAELELHVAGIADHLERYIRRMDSDIARHVTANHRHVG